jgi:hypothetical protein
VKNNKDRFAQEYDWYFQMGSMNKMSDDIASTTAQLLMFDYKYEANLRSVSKPDHALETKPRR